MRIEIRDDFSEEPQHIHYPHLSYSDPQVRYEIGKFRASLDLLNEKGKQDAERKKRTDPDGPALYPAR